MAHTSKFQALADAAKNRVAGVPPEDVDALLQSGAIALDIRDKEEHDAGHIPWSLHISRGRLEMNVEAVLPDLDQTILCYCNAFNRDLNRAGFGRFWRPLPVQFLIGRALTARCFARSPI